jgi:hypothetical protein
VTGPPRDWDKELAEIDKVIAKQPVGGPKPAGPGAPAALPAPRSAAVPPVTRGRAALGGWVRVLLGVAVATGVAVAWPYRHTCGILLYGYLAASAGVLLAGLWGAVASWKRRMALAHLIALLVTLTGAVLVAKVILDRSGYPKTPSTWSCVAP